MALNGFSWKGQSLRSTTTTTTTYTYPTTTYTYWYKYNLLHTLLQPTT